VNKLMAAGAVLSDPLVDHVAAVSCGIYAGVPILDLDYPEDSEAGVDGNFVVTGTGRLVEVQMSAEGSTFSAAELGKLLELTAKGATELVAAQKAAIA
jgi:ribonuclease PH